MVIIFIVALTFDVKDVRFGCQVAICVTKPHKFNVWVNFKSLTLTFCCLSS